jgi:hypothetical protein
MSIPDTSSFLYTVKEPLQYWIANAHFWDWVKVTSGLMGLIIGIILVWEKQKRAYLIVGIIVSTIGLLVTLIENSNQNKQSIAFLKTQNQTTLGLDAIIRRTDGLIIRSEKQLNIVSEQLRNDSTIISESEYDRYKFETISVEMEFNSKITQGGLNSISEYFCKHEIDSILNTLYSISAPKPNRGYIPWPFKGSPAFVDVFGQVGGIGQVPPQNTSYLLYSRDNDVFKGLNFYGLIESDMPFPLNLEMWPKIDKGDFILNHNESIFKSRDSISSISMNTYNSKIRATISFNFISDSVNYRLETPDIKLTNQTRLSSRNDLIGSRLLFIWESPDSSFFDSQPSVSVYFKLSGEMRFKLNNRRLKSAGSYKGLKVPDTR